MNNTPLLLVAPARWLALIAWAAASVSPAHAVPFPDPIYWHMNASACTPTAATAREGRYDTFSSGAVGYRDSTATQELMFICPVTSINDTDPGVRTTPSLRLFYQDPDGVAGRHRVRATMKSYSLLDGAFNNAVCRIISSQEGAWQSQSTPCAFDLGTHLYWVEVVVARSEGSTLPLRFNGIELYGT